MINDSCNEFRAVLQAVHGASDIDDIIDALEVHGAACVVALAPDASPLTRVLAALSADRDDLIRSDDMRVAPVDTLMRWMIGHPFGQRILPAWTRHAPPSWGDAVRDRLLFAAQRHRCPAGAAAALIGPCRESADILSHPDDIATAIMVWGRANPDDPTAWMNAIRDHGRIHSLIQTLETSPQAYARAWPWLPERNRPTDQLPLFALSDALAAFAGAPHVSRIRQRSTIHALVARAPSSAAHALIRLALVMTDDAAMTDHILDRLEGLIRFEPSAASSLVCAVQWRDVPERIASVIGELHDRHMIYRSIAFACGATDDPPPHHPQAAISLFGALDVRIWNMMTRAHQRAWLHALPSHWGYLAVRALGPVPDALACVHDATPEALRAMRVHVTDEDRIRRLSALLALRGAPSPLFFALVRDDARWIADQDGDLHACLAVACGRLVDDFPISFLDASPAFVRSIGATLGALARVPTEDIRTRCTALRFALTTASYDDVARWSALLPVHDPPGVMAPITQACRVASASGSATNGAPDARWDDLAHLEPSVAVPALHALHELLQATSPTHRFKAGAALAESLRRHGAIFWRIVTNLPSPIRDSMLPRQAFQNEHGVRACALHDPSAAFLLFNAFQWTDPWALHDDKHADIALEALQPFPHDIAWRVVRSLTPSFFHALVGYAEQRINDESLADDDERFMSAVDRIRTLHPSAAIAAVRALADVRSAWDESHQRRCSERLFGGLRAHGEEAANLVRTMRDTVRERLLPSRMGDDHRANERAEALLTMVVTHPEHARRLAWALHAFAQFPHDPARIAEVIMAMADLPPRRARPVFDAIPSSLRQRLLPDARTLLDSLGIATDDPSISLHVASMIQNAPVETAIVYGMTLPAIAKHLDDHALDRWGWNNSAFVRILHPLLHAPAIAALLRLPIVHLILADIDSAMASPNVAAHGRKAFRVRRRPRA